MKVTDLLEKFIKGSVVLETVGSPLSGQIKVDEDLFGNKRLLVGNLAQSGKEVENVWQKTIEQFNNLTISNCLILGLGAGNAAGVINKYFPKAKITGVEIDPEIVKLGNKYFGLKEIRNLKIEIENAFVWVDSCINGLIHCNRDNSRFGLILIDLYLGDCFPEKAEEEKFLGAVKKMQTPKGLVIFNRLYFKENIQKTDIFQKKLQKIYMNIEAKRISYNKLFLCRK